MPAAPNEQVALYTTSTRADTEVFAAETVRCTVMAEQVSHHVVNQSESAGASAPADVAANQIDIDIAADGTHTTSNPTPDLTNSKPQASTAADSITVSPAEVAEAATSPAEPSAGEVGAPATEASAAQEQSEEVQGGLPNGVQDASLGDEGSAGDGSADHGANSDTDGSKGDSAEQKKEGNHHARTNSVKKPTTFSRVSVTKSFMAKAASPTPTAAAIGSKPAALNATLQPAAAARPRLVAKTVALKGMKKPRAGSESASGPDASKVWNKNQRMYNVVFSRYAQVLTSCSSCGSSTSKAVHRRRA